MSYVRKARPGPDSALLSGGGGGGRGLQRDRLRRVLRALLAQLLGQLRELILGVDDPPRPPPAGLGAVLTPGRRLLLGGLLPRSVGRRGQRVVGGAALLEAAAIGEHL